MLFFRKYFLLGIIGLLAIFFLRPHLTSREVEISSSLDNTLQKAIFVKSSKPNRPLLVSLHTWSTSYNSYDAFEEALKLSKEKDWSFISPNFRGPNNHPDACASEKALNDVVDAVNFAIEKAESNPEEIYLLGASGGGYMALMLASRFPKKWKAVSAWTPITDLISWHKHCAANNIKYKSDIELCMGSKPNGIKKNIEYYKRSPLYNLAKAKGVNIDIQAGIYDNVVPISHSLAAFNLLAKTNNANNDAIDKNQVNELIRTSSELSDPDNEEAKSKLVKSQLSATTKPNSSDRSHAVIFHKTAGPVSLTIFDGGHEIDTKAAIQYFTKN